MSNKREYSEKDKETWKKFYAESRLSKNELAKHFRVDRNTFGKATKGVKKRSQEDDRLDDSDGA